MCNPLSPARCGHAAEAAEDGAPRRSTELMKNKIKLLICYHKRDVLLKDEVLTPIHVGRALARERSPEGDPQFAWLCENMAGDDTGENISRKNPSHNELTAVYWAWKNYDELGDPDYIGLMHYRRHFIFRESGDVVEEVRAVDENYFARINYNARTMEHLFDDCDFVAHVGRVDEVYKHYKENHHIEDLDLAIAILKRKYPGYAPAADAYLRMSRVNLCNMFIMPRAMFFEYCAWLFDILEEFERQVDLSEKRLFISERLTGIFIEHKRRSGLRQKSLSATFVSGETRVPVAVGYGGDAFRAAVCMYSACAHASPDTRIDFYLLHGGEARGDEFEGLFPAGGRCTVSFVDVPSELKKRGISLERFRFPQHYPLIAAEVLPNENKLVFADERTLFFGDVARLFLSCNNDEFAVLGIPESERGRSGCGAFCLNAARLRAHGFVGAAADIAGLTASRAFAKYAPGQVGRLPWWTYGAAEAASDKKIYYPVPRGALRSGIWERTLLYYGDGAEPWTNIQALYSVYWWEFAARIPSCVPFTGAGEGAVGLFAEQSAELRAALPRRRPAGRHAARGRECVIKRAARYCRRHGIVMTVKRVLAVIRGCDNEG